MGAVWMVQGGEGWGCLEDGSCRAGWDMGAVGLAERWELWGRLSEGS